MFSHYSSDSSLLLRSLIATGWTSYLIALVSCHRLSNYCDIVTYLRAQEGLDRFGDAQISLFEKGIAVFRAYKVCTCAAGSALSMNTMVIKIWFIY
jgi:hypothetical protein